MRIKELDGLRGIAVIAVIAQHYLDWLPITGSTNGWLGVDLFFVLSGFLISSILIKLRHEKHYFSTFYQRRALRIFPPYYLGVCTYLAVSLAVAEPGTLSLWAQYIFYYTSLFVGQPAQLDSEVIFPVKLGLAVLWSLSVEEIYYTIWAPVVRFTSIIGLSTILAAMIVIAPILRWWLHTPAFPELYTFYCRMDALALGSVIAILMYLRKEKEIRLERCLDLIATGMIVATLSLWIWLRGDRTSTLLCTLGISMADISMALSLFAILRKSGSQVWWMRGLRAKWLRSIGMVSYSLYLFHYPIGNVVHSWVATWGISRRGAAALQTILSVAVSLSVAYALWYALEKHILKWKDRHVPSPVHP